MTPIILNPQVTTIKERMDKELQGEQETNPAPGESPAERIIRKLDRIKKVMRNKKKKEEDRRKQKASIDKHDNAYSIEGFVVIPGEERESITGNSRTAIIIRSDVMYTILGCSSKTENNGHHHKSIKEKDKCCHSKS